MISNQLFFEFKSELLKIKDKKKREISFYDKLAKCLKSGQFKAFELLIDSSIDFNIFLDIFRIPNRFDIISKLLLNCTDKISNGYQTSALGEIIEILRFCNNFSLLEKELTEIDQQNLNNFKKKKENKLFLSNLNDLFGRTSDSFILFVYKVMPRDLYEYFISSPISYFPDRDGLMYYIKHVFFDQYTIYGLSIRNLSPIENFFDAFHKNYLYSNRFFEDERNLLSNEDNGLIEFSVIYKYRMFYYDLEEEREYRETKKHLVSPQNILKNQSKILDKYNYNFYSLSMVLLGGLGPQGLGFTYSTPKGELIEICSDQRESEAIIIKYRKYLKNKFILKLGEELKNIGIDENIKEKIVTFLSDILNNEELIDYYKKELILRKIKNYLEQIDEFKLDLKSELQQLVKKISNALSIILRRIQLRDQFVTRMELVAKEKIRSEDIAKLTSLKGKSHYDVLRERFFFQYIINWFYEIYHSEKLKNHNKNNDNKKI
ncbi:MAG: hypothetical protein JSV62_11685 [Promethearchaeota archaeon]|nr:MAG: hypothetical protein JSV62_11685 [Candidatus Lokiarchaeota archaeon]